MHCAQMISCIVTYANYELRLAFFGRGHYYECIIGDGKRPWLFTRAAWLVGHRRTVL